MIRLVWPVRALATAHLLCSASATVAQTARSVHVQAAISVAPVTTGSDRANRWRGILVLDVAPGWHIYAEKPGTVGIPSALRWQLAPGWKVASTRWPTPTQRIRGRDTTFEYASKVTVQFELSSQVGTSAAAAHELDATYGVCRDICIPERLALSFRTPARK